MNMEAIKQRVSDLFNSIDFRLNDNFCSEYVNDYVDELPDGYSYATGISKCVIIPQDTNWVIKIPFAGQWDEYAEDDEKEIIPFDSAYYPDEDRYGWDYCRTEAEIYSKAKEAGISRFFARTYYLMDWCGWPIYIQEKCVTFYDTDKNIKTRSKKQQKTVIRKMRKYGKQFSAIVNKNWLYDLFAYTPARQVNHLFNFINEIDIEDLHSSNYGYAAVDGRALLLDFSSFND